jgi:hypothetical protein
MGNRNAKEKYEYKEHQSTYQKNNQTYKFIGIHEFKHVDQSESHGSKEVSRYYIYLSQIINGYKQVYQIIGHNSFADCQSGYIPATYGWLSEITKYNYDLPPLHYTLKNGYCGSVRLIEMKPNQNEYVKNIPENDYNNGNPRLYPKITFPCALDEFQLRNLDDVTIMNCSREGDELSEGYGLYPQGYCMINKDVLVSSIRTKEKHPVYVFKGKSGLGKSFIANQLVELDVYETDLGENIPENISDYHIVVVGNKYPNQFEIVKKLLTDNNTEIVNVDFT